MNRRLAAIVLAALAGPAFAEDATRSPAGVFYDTCAAFVTGAATAVADAKAAGWTFQDDVVSPVQTNVYAQRTIAGVGDASLVAVTETYPGTEVHFCRIDVFQPAGKIGIEPLDARDGLVGTIITADDGLYGSWEDDRGGALGRVLVQAQDASTSFVQLSIYETKAPQ